MCLRLLCIILLHSARRVEDLESVKRRDKSGVQGHQTGDLGHFRRTDLYPGYRRDHIYGRRVEVCLEGQLPVLRPVGIFVIIAIVL